MGFYFFVFYKILEFAIRTLFTCYQRDTRIKKNVILTNNFLSLGDKANYKLGCTIKFVIFNNLTLIVCQMTLS